MHQQEEVIETRGLEVNM
jgi:hypothetical protein